ncbi:MAG: 30S ribosomal protein S6 [Verrucomicrobia subdivision 3 bacterium]|nr:30S ribosomal protein S6 [Limisphaerales bacterium]MCS1412974.1 30S ribosomal protein S6 [Limisphaerales bacterium]
MKQYDGLFILNSVGHEDSVDEMIDGVTSCISDAGGKVELVERMESKPFARVANSKYKSGFYFSVLFKISVGGLQQVQAALRDNDNVFRSLISLAKKRPPLAANVTTE